jgi:hypothetical protein
MAVPRAVLECEVHGENLQQASGQSLCKFFRQALADLFPDTKHHRAQQTARRVLAPDRQPEKLFGGWKVADERIRVDLNRHDLGLFGALHLARRMGIAEDQVAFPERNGPAEGAESKAADDRGMQREEVSPGLLDMVHVVIHGHG